MTLGASTNVPVRLVRSHGRNQLRLRREPPRDTGGDIRRSAFQLTVLVPSVGRAPSSGLRWRSQKICAHGGELSPQPMSALVASQKVSVRAGRDRTDL